MVDPVWIGFCLSLALLMAIGRRSTWLGLLVAALVLAIFGLEPARLGEEAWRTATDPSILLLALAVGMIPVLGGAMEVSGLADDIVSNLRLRRRHFLVAAPALFGMLPMPGGALLSAPLVKRGGSGVGPVSLAAANVWFRHSLLIAYPLGALLVTTKMAGVDLFVAIAHLLPGLAVIVIIGSFFLLREARGRLPARGRPDRRRLAIALSVILVAPVLDLALLLAFPGALPEVPLVIAVAASLALAILAGGIPPAALPGIGHRMKAWNFSLIILAMFLFLNVFTSTRAPELIAGLPVHRAVLLVWLGALLGYATGRVQVPVSILVPIYFVKYGVDAMAAPAFATMYFATFIGFMASPVHPCVVVSLEYFGVSHRDYMRALLPPTAISLAAAFIFALCFL
ncbi:MAG: DUF401 family protein [Thermoplasmata archaeon]|nr:DUF401 family protein [Thermoplasmata archaeon]